MTEIVKASELSKQIISEVERAIVGKRGLLEMIMASVLAGGHVLLEDYPGLGKTLIARSFASVRLATCWPLRGSDGLGVCMSSRLRPGGFAHCLNEKRGTGGHQ